MAGRRRRRRHEDAGGVTVERMGLAAHGTAGYGSPVRTHPVRIASPAEAGSLGLRRGRTASTRAVEGSRGVGGCGRAILRLSAKSAGAWR